MKNHAKETIKVDSSQWPAPRESYEPDTNSGYLAQDDNGYVVPSMMRISQLYVLKKVMIQRFHITIKYCSSFQY